MRKLILLFCFLFAAYASAQVDSTFYAKQYPGSTVRDKVTAAMASCTGVDESIKCYVVIEPSLAAYPTGGTLPTPCGHCYVIDYRTNPFASGAGVSKIDAGANVSVSPAGGTGEVTIAVPAATPPTGSGNKVYATPADGSSAAAALRKLIMSDLPFVVDNTSISITDGIMSAIGVGGGGGGGTGGGAGTCTGSTCILSLPGGMYLKSGIATTASNGNLTVTLPSPDFTGDYVVVATTGSGSPHSFSIEATETNLTSFAVYSWDEANDHVATPFSWIAVGPGPVTSGTGTSGGSSTASVYPSADTLFYFNTDSIYLAGTVVSSTSQNDIGNLPMQLAMSPALNQGNPNSGVLTVTSCASSSTQAVLTYTGTPAPFVNQLTALSGLTGTNCSTLNTATAKVLYNVTAVGTGTFTVKASGLTTATEAQTATATLYANLINASESGYSVDLAITAYTTKVHPYSPAVTGKPGIIIDNLGGNNILGGSTVSALEPQIAALWALYRADGWTVVRSTILDLPGSAYCYNGASNCQPEVLTLNDWTRAQIANAALPDGFDRLVDVSQIIPDNTNVLFFNAAHPGHPTPAGASLLLGPFVASILGQSSAPTTGVTCFPSNACASTQVDNHFSHGQTITAVTGNAISAHINNSTQIDAATFTADDFSIFNRVCIGLQAGSTGYLCRASTGVAGLWQDGDYLALSNQGHQYYYDSFKVYDTGFVNNDTAPTGTCPVSGVWQFTKDGKGSYCKAGTWEVAVTAP